MTHSILTSECFRNEACLSFQIPLNPPQGILRKKRRGVLAVIIKPEPIPSHTQGTPRMLSTLQGKELISGAPIACSRIFFSHPLLPEWGVHRATALLAELSSSAFPSVPHSGRPTGRRQGNRKVKGRTWKNGSGKENLASPGCGEGLALRERQGWCQEESPSG